MDIHIRFSIDDNAFQFFSKKLENIEDKLNDILTKETQTMAQIDDLNTAIQNEDVEVTTILASITTIAADVAKLKAAVAAGSSPTDLTNQITAVQAHLASLTTGQQQLVDADKAANA
jgi:chromosome segregation ATPase